MIHTQNSKTQPLYQRIVDKIDNYVDSSGKIWGLCEADDGFVGISVYSDEGDHILRHEMLDELAYPVLDAWNAEPEGKRWVYFELVIDDANFTIDFSYPGEFDPDEGLMGRLRRLLEKHFGNKPINNGSSVLGDID